MNLIVATTMLGIATAEIVFSEELREIKINCAKSEGIDSSYIGQVDSVNWPTYEEVKCYPYCVVRKFGFVTEEGFFSYDAVMHKTPPEQRDVYRSIVERCVHTNASDPCRRSYQGYRCYAEGAYRISNKT